MTVRMRTIDYQEGDYQEGDYEEGSVVLSGELAWDDAWTSPRPAVVIVHDAMKSTGGFEEGRAATLAGRGYAGFVLDVYGKGVHGRDFDESLALMTPFQQDRAALLRRLHAGLATAARQPEVDAKRLAAIGYCFGGMCVLDLARANAPLLGVASFHGLLTPPPAGTASPFAAAPIESPPIAAKVLVLHGWDDPFVPAETVHGFSNPSANLPALGAMYDAKADRRSWQVLENFLAEIFR